MPLKGIWETKTIWCIVITVVTMVTEVVALSGANVCMVQQKYNITKRVKYRAPMSIRTYEWCFSMPPRCSKWSTEMRDLTRLETEERTAEVAVCCPGYKMKDVSCVPICPPGKTGTGCSQDCPPNKWGPNCVNECPVCQNGECSPTTGDCDCDDGWQGESCQVSMTTVPAPPALMEKLLTTTKSSVKTFPTTISAAPPTNSIPEIPFTTPMTTTTLPTTKMTTIKLTTTKKTEKTPTTFTTPLTKPSSIPVNNVTKQLTTTWIETLATNAPRITLVNSIYNRTEIPTEGTSDTFIKHDTSTMKIPITTNAPVTTLSSPSSTSVSQTINSTNSPTTTPTTTTSTTTSSPTTAITSIITTKMTTILTSQVTTKFEHTKKPENTNRNHSTTIKFKPKEIWIKPTQKGESTLVETKIKNIYDLNTKVKTEIIKNEAVSENTTPRTIIVSIIPTSVSHATFKKIALTTASYLSKKTNISLILHNRTDQGFTKSMTAQVSTATPFTIKLLSTLNAKNLSSSKTTLLPKPNITRKLITPSNKIFLQKTTTDKQISKAFANTTMATSRTTNSMPSTSNGSKKLNSSISLTTKILTNKQSKHRNTSHDATTMSAIITKLKPPLRDEGVKTHQSKANHNITKETKTKLIHENRGTVTTKANVPKVANDIKITTQEPPEDETFHILTEPEHITAVMSEGDRDHTSMDLLTVIGIAGGVMIAVITVAVVIVMIERCKRPRYDDVRKVSEMRMQAVMDNTDTPPPYVRSIFHTPLPDPPHSDKCHYQPISTLDRNLKQFMRPVVVQTISPVMLENFRGILECHYDHLPRRNDFGTMPTRCSVSPSTRCDDELLRQRPLSAADYTIESLKCEAKLDVIDNTTSEPLYAEIPCWRPPSEHAIAVVNLNGEAMTEL